MHEMQDGKWTQDTQHVTQNVRSQFDLLDELSRGALYRGGDDADDFIRGYGTGFWLGVLFLIVMFIVGSMIG